MSFFPMPDKKSTRKTISKSDAKLLQSLGCEGCPLSSNRRNKNPDMPASGTKSPLVYMLGEAPGHNEDERGSQFVGNSGQLLRDLIPTKYEKQLRWNNVVRTRPIDDAGKNMTPPWQAVEACRPSVIKDIEESKPHAIFGFGRIPLNWLTGMDGIYSWRGRRVPVKVGSHSCWYFPMLHPAAILQAGKFGQSIDDDDNDDSESLGSDFINEDHRMLKFDLERAFVLVEAKSVPFVHTDEIALADIDIIEKFTDKALTRIETRLNGFLNDVVIGIDYETNGLRPYLPESKVLTAAVSNGKQALAIPFDHPGSEWTTEQRQRLTLIWKNFLGANTLAIKTVHNLSFEMEWTAVKFGKELIRIGRWECTQVLASILDQRYSGPGGTAGPLSLEFLVYQQFGINIKKLAAVDRGNLENTPLPHVLQYNGMDAKYHALLFKRLNAAIRNAKLEKAYSYAIRRVPTLVLTQIKGMPVSQKACRELQTKYAARIKDISKKIAANPTAKKYAAKYGEFNPLASGQCVQLFHGMLNRSECEVFDKKKKTGRVWVGKDGEQRNKLSCDEEVLKQIKHPLADLTIRLRKAQKLQSTYIEPLLEGSPILWPGSRLHPTFSHTFTHTGRLAAEDPNAQNYPKRGEEAKEVRRSVSARKGKVMVAIDYGQIEARVIAMESKDETFVKMLWERYDIHKEWAERVSSVVPQRVGGRKNRQDKAIMKNFRTDIKNEWTFPLVFGASLKSVCYYLSQNEFNYRVEPHQLEDLYDEFWEQFDGIKKWQNRLVKFYEKQGYVETFTGRRRHGPMSINKIINSPIQGFTAELVLEGMCRLSESGDPLLQPNIQIHDDITWCDVPEDKVDHVAEKAIDILLNPPFECINVPLSLEMSVGPNWLNMSEVGTFYSDEWNK